jgi:hypothetical protein
MKWHKGVLLGGFRDRPFLCPLWLHRKKGAHMPITTLKVLSTVLQLHGPGATIQSDHQGINAVLNDLRGQNAEATQVYFRRGGFIRGGGYGGGFRRAGYGGGGFRRGGFVRY